MPSVKEWLFGKPPSTEKLPTVSPEQEKFFNQYLQQLMQSQNNPLMQQGQQGFGQAQDYYSGLLGPGAFEQFAQPYKQQFEQQIMPRIADRFAGYGANSGALSSTGFGQALAGGASDFQSKLAQLFSQLQMQAAGGLGQNYGNLQNNYNTQAQMGLGFQPFAYQQNPGMGGAWAQLAAAAMKTGAGGMGGF
jgi:hypothetical protein